MRTLSISAIIIIILTVGAYQLALAVSKSQEAAIATTALAVAAIAILSTTFSNVTISTTCVIAFMTSIPTIFVIGLVPAAATIAVAIIVAIAAMTIVTAVARENGLKEEWMFPVLGLEAGAISEGMLATHTVVSTGIVVISCGVIGFIGYLGRECGMVRRSSSVVES